MDDENVFQIDDENIFDAEDREPRVEEGIFFKTEDENVFKMDEESELMDQDDEDFTKQEDDDDETMDIDMSFYTELETNTVNDKFEESNFDYQPTEKYFKIDQPDLITQR